MRNKNALLLPVLSQSVTSSIRLKHGKYLDVPDQDQFDMRSFTCFTVDTLQNSMQNHI